MMLEHKLNRRIVVAHLESTSREHDVALKRVAATTTAVDRCDRRCERCRRISRMRSAFSVLVGISCLE